MNKSPAFSFYVRDWLSSNSVTKMSGDAVKAYLYLLCSSWLEDDRATLPNDDIDLAKLARVTNRKWSGIKNMVLSNFLINNDGKLYNERLMEISNLQIMRSKVGSKGGSKRASKLQAKDQSNTEAKGEAKPKLSSSPSSSTSKEIINMLNGIAEREFRHTQSHCKYINARLNEGFTIEDFRAVIKHKTEQWKNDPEMSKFLQPSTLFGTKFDGYLQDAQNKVEPEEKDPVIQYRYHCKDHGFGVRSDIPDLYKVCPKCNRQLVRVGSNKAPEEKYKPNRIMTHRYCPKCKKKYDLPLGDIDGAKCPKCKVKLEIDIS